LSERAEWTTESEPFINRLMEITKAVLEDIPELCKLLDALFNQEAEFKADRDAQKRGLAAVIRNPEIGDILVARSSGRIIGMVNLLYTVSTALGGRVGILEDMVVSPKERGSGVGTELLNHAVRYAVKKGCKRITLLTDKDNLGARRFYQKLGFNRSHMVVFRKLL
jgi:GNAT superfamily N-acetyltransferase